MKDARLLIRADADSQTGYGHVMRCLALAQQWNKLTGGSVRFASHRPETNIATRILDEGFRLIPVEFRPGSRADALQVSDYAGSSPDETIIIDGYQFGSEYQSIVTDANLQTLVIDDYGHLDAYHAHVLLNQNAGIEAKFYAGKTAAETELLTGSGFALLRQEFLEKGPDSTDESFDRTNVLIALGGSDPDAVTQMVIDAIRLVPGDTFSFTLLSPIPGLRINDARITLVPFSSDMSELYRRSGFAICAGGSTNWEMSYFGIPRLVIVLADNQRGIASSLEDLGCCQSLGWHQKLTPDKIASALLILLTTETSDMSRRNRTLVDGQGAVRVVQRLVERLETALSKPKTSK